GGPMVAEPRIDEAEILSKALSQVTYRPRWKGELPVKSVVSLLQGSMRFVIPIVMFSGIIFGGVSFFESKRFPEPEQMVEPQTENQAEKARFKQEKELREKQRREAKEAYDAREFGVQKVKDAIRVIAALVLFYGVWHAFRTWPALEREQIEK